MRIVRARLVALSVSATLFAGAAGVQAQTTVEEASPVASPARSPGIAEVALCLQPELGLPTGSLGPQFASLLGTGAGDAALPSGLAGPIGGSSGCRAPQGPLADPFGRDELTAFFVNDPADDGALDLLRTSWTPYEIDRDGSRRIRRLGGIQISGKPARAVGPGRGTLIVMELAERLRAGDSIHVATDVRGDATKRTPSSVEQPASALSNVRDLYSLFIRDDGEPFVASSDLSTGEFYTGDQPFAAFFTGPTITFFIPAGGLGDDFRVIATRQGEGSDAGGLGAEPGLLATDGLFGWHPECVDHVLIHEPLVLDDVEVSYSRGEVVFCFAASEADLDLVGDFLDDVGDAGVGSGSIGFRLDEDGQDEVQERPLDVWIGDDERIYFAFPIGYRAYGFHALTDVGIVPTGDLDLDAIFGEAAVAIGRWLNPVTFDAAPGDLQGAGECTTRPVG